jgi:hypothetical protein
MKLEKPQTVLDTGGEKLCSACAGKPTLVSPPNFRHCTAANNSSSSSSNNNNNNTNNGYQNNPTAQPYRPSQRLH